MASGSAADKLPVEVVSQILTHLSVSDRKDASLVCRKWYEASLHPTLINDLVVMLNSSHIGPTLQESLKLLHNRSGIHLSLGDIHDMVDVDAFVGSCQPALCAKLSSLDLTGSNLSESAFVATIGNCHNLQMLDLSCCNSLLLSGMVLTDKLANVRLPKLKSLNLTSLHHLSDATLGALLGMAPKLEMLNLTSVPMMFGSMSMFSSNDGRPSSAAVTFDVLLTQIQQLASTLKSLNLSRTGITDSCLLALAQAEGVNLSALQLLACKEITNSGIVAIVKNIPELQSLDLSYNSQLGDATLKEIALHLTKLKQLNMKNITVGQSSMKYLRMLPVESLVMSGCLKIDLPPVVADDTFQAWAKNMTSLDLSGCPSLARETLSSLCQQLVKLEELDLTSCFNVDDSVVREISKNLTGLTHLSLGWCSKITDFGLIGIVDKEFSHSHSDDTLCRCSRADLSGATNVPQFFYDSPAKNIIPDAIPTKDQINQSLASLENEQPYPLFRLSKLVQLDLSSCRKLTDSSVVVAMRFPALTELNLSLCSRLTDDCLPSIAQHNPLLETLSLGSCRAITDSGLEVVIKSCRRLSGLFVPNCQLLTDRTIYQILASGLKVKYIDVSYSNISTDAINRLEKKLPYLRTVHKRYSSSKIDRL